MVGLCGGCLTRNVLVPDTMACETCSENYRKTSRNDPFIGKDEVHRLEKEGQNNPKDQLRSSIGAMRGWIHNLETEISTPNRVAEHLKFHINQLESIIARYPDLSWDSEPFTPEKKRE